MIFQNLLLVEPINLNMSNVISAPPEFGYKIRASTNVKAVGAGTAIGEKEITSAELLNLVAGSIAELEQGNPEDFIPGYSTLSQQLREKFWAELLIAMAKFESNWNPKDQFLEQDGQWSIGLLQLSLGDQNNYHLEPRIERKEDLKDPFINLQWGVQIFTHLLVRDGVVASGSDDNDEEHGGARYWSVLRAGHKVDQIKGLTKKNVGLT